MENIFRYKAIPSYIAESFVTDCEFSEYTSTDVVRLRCNERAFGDEQPNHCMFCPSEVKLVLQNNAVARFRNP